MPCCFGTAKKSYDSAALVSALPDPGRSPDRGADQLYVATKSHRAGGVSVFQGRHASAGRDSPLYAQAGSSSVDTWQRVRREEDEESEPFYSVREEDSDSEKDGGSGGIGCSTAAEGFPSKLPLHPFRGGFGSLENMIATPLVQRLATPMNAEEELGYIMEFLDKFRREERQGLWNLALDKAECKVWKRFIELGGSSSSTSTSMAPPSSTNTQQPVQKVLFFLAESIIHAPPEVVMHLIQNVQLRMSWEDNFMVDEMLEGDYYRGIERVVIRSPVFGFSNREIIRFREARCTPAFQYPYLAYERSTSSRDCAYPPTGKQVRVTVFMSGNTLEPGPKPGTTLLRVITDSNPGGAIPSAAVNLVVASIPRQWSQKLNKECLKFMAKEPVNPLPEARLRELVENLNSS
ncbi:unnamed protein product [Amoebophrya sp. A120]|nr:unnamed protein product [Amoebophrya sp. A120]|eukprot:GSA120T00015222001.1